VYAVLTATLESGERELRIVAAQDAIAHPDCEFEVRQVR
jgi:pyridoxine kinase